MLIPVRLPDAARNPVSILGMAIASAAAVVFLALFALEVAGYLTNPYIGLLVFVTALPQWWIVAGILAIVAIWVVAFFRDPVR